MPTLRPFLRPCAAAGLLVVAAALCGCHGQGRRTPPPPVPSFTLAVAPSSLSIPAGGGGFATVTVNRIGGFADAVTLALGGAPSGVVGSGTVAAGAHTGQLSLLVDAQVGAQTLAFLRITGSSGGLEEAASFPLVVTAPLPVGQIPTNQVAASGGGQRGGGFANTAVVLEPVMTRTSKDASGNLEVRSGFQPAAAHP